MKEEIFYILLGAVLAVVAGVLLLFVEYRFKIFARQKKKLIYEILAVTPIITIGDEMEEYTSGKLQILFDSKPVQNVIMLVIKICNEGNVEIKREDYEQPIRIGFMDEAHILKTSVIDKNPTNLPISLGNWFTDIGTPVEQIPDLAMDKWHGIDIKPVLLNPDDYVTLSVLVSNYKGDFKIEGRIVGIKKIEKIEKKELTQTILLIQDLVEMIPIIGPIIKILDVFPREKS